MKFYRVKHYVEGGSSGGYTWTTSKDEAERAVREHAKLNPGKQANEIEPVGHHADQGRYPARPQPLRRSRGQRVMTRAPVLPGIHRGLGGARRPTPADTEQRIKGFWYAVYYRNTRGGL